jgi:hypothetical protein
MDGNDDWIYPVVHLGDAVHLGHVGTSKRIGEIMMSGYWGMAAYLIIIFFVQVSVCLLAFSASDWLCKRVNNIKLKILIITMSWVVVGVVSLGLVWGL